MLAVAAGEMHHDGDVFYRSGNGVWLAEHVPPRYLSHR
jgi:putative RNA 2'-phosphotransferase